MHTLNTRECWQLHEVNDSKQEEEDFSYVRGHGYIREVIRCWKAMERRNLTGQGRGISSVINVTVNAIVNDAVGASTADKENSVVGSILLIAANFPSAPSIRIALQLSELSYKSILN